MHASKQTKTKSNKTINEKKQEAHGPQPSPDQLHFPHIKNQITIMALPSGHTNNDMIKYMYI